MVSAPSTIDRKTIMTVKNAEPDKLASIMTISWLNLLSMTPLSMDARYEYGALSSESSK